MAKRENVVYKFMTRNEWIVQSERRTSPFEARQRKQIGTASRHRLFERRHRCATPQRIRKCLMFARQWYLLIFKMYALCLWQTKLFSHSYHIRVFICWLTWLMGHIFIKSLAAIVIHNNFPKWCAQVVQTNVAAEATANSISRMFAFLQAEEGLKYI